MIRFILIFFFLITYSYKANSLELIMYDSKYCFYCKKFLKEVGSDYNLPQLPLIVIDDKNQPRWFYKAVKKNKIKPIRGTPTFIIWDEKNKIEIDRIVGYGNKDDFYKKLRSLFVNFINENKSSS
tara:strand:- start:3274 stop:3648 length:375 start_codon:yes stop_codon:yes gene_type:complete